MLPGCAARTHEAAGRRACVGGVASWRPLSGRLAPPRRGCAVTSLAGQDRQTLSNMPSAIRRRRIEFNIQMEQVTFQRFADARTALASGDLDITAFGPQDISLALGQGTKTLVGIAGVGSGNDCLIVRKGDDIKDWKALTGKTIGVGAGSISWLKFAASVQENGGDYGKLKVINVMGGGGNYLKALQAKEIDMAVV